MIPDVFYRYYNVPGALLRPALAVYDTMQAMSNEIETLNLGLTTGGSRVLSFK
jgi:ATP-dependent protease ClpP protease subunit